MSTNYITQITDTAGTTHDLKDTSASHYVKGTQTASTNAWTGDLPDGVTAYYDGLSIDYFLPYAGTSTAATLNLGGLGAKKIYRGNAPTNGIVTTHYPVCSVIHMTYVVNSSINSGNGAWVASAYYDSNTNTWRAIQVNGTQELGNSASTGAINFKDGDGITLSYSSGIVISHSNSVTAATAGTSSATSGSSLSVPYITYDSEGHITAAGTHKHTISGFLTSSSSLNAAKLTGTVPASCYTNTTYSVATTSEAGLMSATDKTKLDGIVDLIYPIGSCFVGSTIDMDPNDLFSGTSWTLVDKMLKNEWYTDVFTFNTTNTEGGESSVLTNGHTVEYRLTWYNKVALSDSTITIGTMDQSTVGIVSTHQCYMLGQNDALNSIGMFIFNGATENATLQSWDWVSRLTGSSYTANFFPSGTGQSSSVKNYVNFTIGLNMGNMIDSFCDRFIWERTA